MLQLAALTGVKPPGESTDFACCELAGKSPSGLALGGASKPPLNPLAGLSLGGATGSKPPVINMANFSKALKKNVEGIIANKVQEDLQKQIDEKKRMIKATLDEGIKLKIYDEMLELQ